MEEKEKWDRRVALMTTAGIHMVLLLLLVFLIAWRAPNPPLPEYGIELNFGVDNVGSGDNQPEDPIATGEPEPDSQPVAEEPNDEEPVDEILEDTMEEPNESEDTQPVEPPIEEAEPQPEATEETTTPDETTPEDTPVDQDINEIESPVQQPKETQPPKEEVDPKESEEKPNEPVVKQPVEKPISKPAEETINTDGTTENTENTQQGKPDEGVAESQGVDEEAPGDQGDPKGKIDADALYGGGGEDGFALSMAGWAWADKPQLPQFSSNEAGRIVFEIICDNEGDIIGIKTLERGISPSAEQKLKQEIMKNSLIRTSSGKVPQMSKGRVVFVVKTR